MLRYTLRRLGVNVPVLVVVTILLFVLIHSTPGTPLDFYAPEGQSLPVPERRALLHQLGLDQPLPIQYLRWLLGVAHGQLGYSAQGFQPVTTEIGTHIGLTVVLVASGMIAGAVLGISLGMLSAVRESSWIDHLLGLLGFGAFSTPSFLIGLVVLFVFALEFRWFPAGGASTPGNGSILDVIHHLLLPAGVLALGYAAVIMRYTRAAVLEELSQDYVRTAKAKGARSVRVLGIHTLRNALLPIVTILGASLPSLIGGAVFVESVFSWPGMGTLFLQAVQDRDYPTIMGIALLVSVTVLVVNLLTDLLYGLIDPRIRLGTR